MKRLEYQEVPEWSREFALGELNSGNTKRIVEALLALAFNDEDWQLIQDLMIQYSNHAERDIRYMAILCFGHICRIHRTLDKEKVLPILEKGLKDKDEHVRDAAENALNDIEIFYERPCDQ